MKQTEDRESLSPLRLVVSRCLLGEAVRYDGASKPDAEIMDLAAQAELLPVCPEVEAGLAIPRPPVQLVDEAGQIRMRGVDHPALDVTPQISEFARRFIGQQHDVHGWILKARSPSCGIGDTPLHDAARMPVGLDSGLFARAVQQNLPSAPLITEVGLQDMALRNSFFERVFVLRYWQEHARQGRSLSAFHARMRGHLLAHSGLPSHIERLERLAQGAAAAYLAQLMALLTTPVTASALARAAACLLATRQDAEHEGKELVTCVQAGHSLPICLTRLAPHEETDSLLLAMSEQEWRLRFA